MMRASRRKSYGLTEHLVMAEKCPIEQEGADENIAGNDWITYSEEHGQLTKLLRCLIQPLIAGQAGAFGVRSIMSTAAEEKIENSLLASLPSEEYEQLKPHLKPVELSLGEILFEPPDIIRSLYFPTTSIISFLTELPDGDSVEVGLVGYEGIAGVDVILGVNTASKVATVQHAGYALKISAPALKEAFNRGGKLQQYLLRYTHALMSQISASVLCNARHKIDERLARWVLMYHSRAGTDEFIMTHEFVANMLGIRRAGVSEIAKKLQHEGLIDYHRGHFRILKRKGLEEKACGCFTVIEEEFNGLYKDLVDANHSINPRPRL